jgi:type IV secretory pathway TraG/TraD family ATPase VirD4
MLKLQLTAARRDKITDILRTNVEDLDSLKEQWKELRSWSVAFHLRQARSETSVATWISGWIDTAINALISQDPHPVRRLWFVLDALPALQKLPSLESGMAEPVNTVAASWPACRAFPN